MIFARFCCVFLLSIAVLFSTSCEAQTVTGDRVEANWTADGQQFWYESQLGDGRSLFWFVDAKAGKREPLFDLENMAQALAAETGESADAIKSLSQKGSDPLRRGHEKSILASPPKGLTPLGIGS